MLVSTELNNICCLVVKKCSATRYTRTHFKYTKTWCIAGCKQRVKQGIFAA